MATGWGYTSDGSEVQNVFKLTASGQLDTSFGTAGNTLTPRASFPGQSWAILKKCRLDSLNRILCVGFGEPGGAQYDMVSVRYLSDGRLDTSFGTSGLASYDHGGAETLLGLQVFSDNTFMAVGYRDNLGTGGEIAIVGRFLTNGGLDTEFGTSGTGWIYYPSKTDRNDLRGIVVDNEGRILVSGLEGNTGDQPNVVLRRFWNP